MVEMPCLWFSSTTFTEGSASRRFLLFYRAIPVLQPVAKFDFIFSAKTLALLHGKRPNFLEIFWIGIHKAYLR